MNMGQNLKVNHVFSGSRAPDTSSLSRQAAGTPQHGEGRMLQPQCAPAPAGWHLLIRTEVHAGKQSCPSWQLRSVVAGCGCVRMEPVNRPSAFLPLLFQRCGDPLCTPALAHLPKCTLGKSLEG